MRRVIFIFVLIAGFALGGLALAAQDKSTVTIKKTEVNNGVIIVSVIQDATPDQEKLSLELHCNKDETGCKALDSGTYLMVRLPKNWGMYDCANVDLYPALGDIATTQRIGEYCLIKK
jgi:hypothetical protein